MPGRLWPPVRVLLINPYEIHKLSVSLLSPAGRGRDALGRRHGNRPLPGPELPACRAAGTMAAGPLLLALGALLALRGAAAGDGGW